MTDLKPYSAPRVISTAGSLSVEKQERIAELREEGLTMGVIGERLGLHLNTVYKYCLKLGLTVRRSCQCGRPVRGGEERCYVCRGHRESTRSRQWVVVVRGGEVLLTIAGTTSALSPKSARRASQVLLKAAQQAIEWRTR